MTGQTLAHYKVLEKLGAGGMGEVWRATDTKLGRDVALKVLPPEFARNPERVARFEREARLLAALNHPNIAAIYGFEQVSGVSFLVLEYVPGETLKGPIPVDEGLRVALQIAEAFEEAHDKGVMHRDLKPGNIKITPEGKVKVLDFGLAKALDDDPGAGDPRHSPTMSLAATRAGVILGTAGYMAPEQAKGKPADRRADIWAFGVVVVELLTGRLMFTGETVPETLAAVMKDEPSLDRLPAETPASIRRLLGRCLQKDPRRRLRDIGEARIVIEDTLSGATVEAPETQPTPAAPSPIPQPPSPARAWAAAALAAVAALALAFVHFREKPPERPLAKLTLLPPDKASFADIVISPDGQRLAFTARGASGTSQLWVRPLNSLAAQPLSGTDRALVPFWSPDSRFIGFFAENKLKKIDVFGGPPQTLCDATAIGGGTWNRDGVIVFAHDRGSRLSRVSSAGGQSREILTPDKSRQQNNVGWPHFLPDGRHFLYLARGSQREQSAIFVAALDSPDRRQILAADSSVGYADTPSGVGYLLFIRERTLTAQPFDPVKLETSGEPFPVAEQVGQSGPGPPVHGHFSLSETGVLVYDSAGSAGLERPAWFDRAGKQLEPAAEPGAYTVPALSPDETRLALDRREGGSSDIWTFDLARAISTRFTFDPASDTYPVWSPDGSRILFASNREGTNNLYQKIASGAGSDELLLKSPEMKFPTDWSRDGRFIAYTQQDPKTNSDLWVLPLEGDRKPLPFLRTEFTEQSAQFSPDGRWIAYTSDEANRTQVYVQPFPATGAKWQISRDGGFNPRWRRDGKELFFNVSGTRELMSAEVKLPGRDAKGAAASFQAGVPKLLFVAPSFSRFAVSKDGQRFLLIVPAAEDTGPTPATVVIHWASGIRR